MLSEYEINANRFLTKHHLVFRAVELEVYEDEELTKRLRYPAMRTKYRCTISGRGRGRTSFVFHNSVNDTSDGKEPRAYDLLACLQKYDPGDFENFCSEFGYDTDSRSAHKTWKAVVNEWRKVRKFFTDEELEQLQEIS